jgi:enoyl-[acyl-carrier-protein] reductase (NADH)
MNRAEFGHDHTRNFNVIKAGDRNVGWHIDPHLLRLLYRAKSQHVIATEDNTGIMAEARSPHGITANAIGPGFFPTELTAPVFAHSERAARKAAQTCMNRNRELRDLGGPLLFLCSDASSDVTGKVLMVDGGFTANESSYL